MERRKLTVEEFNELVGKMNGMLNEAQKIADEREDDSTFSMEEFFEKFLQEYLKLRDELLSYDLSNVPFEGWKDGPELWAEVEEIVDFSNTHANIDFDILYAAGKGNYRGCNVKNLYRLRHIDDESFDKEVIEANPDLFLSDKFSYDFKRKYYNRNLTIGDITTLSSEELDELIIKDANFERFLDDELLNFFKHNIDLERIIELYSRYLDDYEYIRDLFSKSFIRNVTIRHTDEEFYQKLNECDISEMKNLINMQVKDILIDFNYDIDLALLPDVFIKDNEDLLLISSAVSDELREKYYSRRITLKDIKDNIEIFMNVPVHKFMLNDTEKLFVQSVGIENIKKIIASHERVYNEISTTRITLTAFAKHYNPNEDFGIAFPKAVKGYFLECYGKNRLEKKYDQDGREIFALPDWMSSLGFKVVDKYTDINDIATYDSNTFVLDESQATVIEAFGFEFLKKFDDDAGYFSRHGAKSKFLNMQALGLYLKKEKDGIIPTLSTYEEFTDFMANCFDEMRAKNYFTDFISYDYIEGDFRNKYKYIFIDKAAPTYLRDCFYRHRITPLLLMENKVYINYLLDKNLKNVISGNYLVYARNSEFSSSNQIATKANFIEGYANEFGNRALLELLSMYGELCSDLSLGVFDFASKETMDRDFKRTIYKNIITKRLDYSFLANDREDGGIPEFAHEYPDIFIDMKSIPVDDEDVRFMISQGFYEGKVYFADFYKYPQLKDYFKSKNLRIAFGDYIDKEGKTNGYVRNSNRMSTDFTVIMDKLGNEKFLELCCRYGRYLEGISSYRVCDVDLPFEDLSLKIEDIIAKRCKEGNIRYYPEDAPKFLKEEYPELFLSEEAPELLQQLFYYNGLGEGLTFEMIKTFPEWIPYLKDKSVETALIRKSPSNREILKYFEYFGREVGLKLGVRKPETVTEMINARQALLMKKWYDKTGQKFVPDYVVMQAFPFEEADKFLVGTSNWSNLMRIKSFSNNAEGRDVILKLAYSFGAFDQDNVGMKKLHELLTGVPRHLTGDIYNNLLFVEEKIIEYEKALMENEDNSLVVTMPMSILEYEHLREELVKMGCSLAKGEPILHELFQLNEDKSATLKINPQSNVKVATYLREFLEKENISLGSYEAHRLFGGFELRYDKDFREFLLANLDEIRENPEYSSYIAGIQRQFSAIRAYNSNRHLTLDLAISFVQSNKYENINVGNEIASEISAIAGYTQEQFDTLQKIYNYGKQRTFSSIPRIEKVKDGYTYQMLRLDDPLAMAIGTLTDCCQELGDAAEVCMEHSMVDKNGRVFVIKDEEGNVVAQSWVWRNKDVLCFDNIEIPHKAFVRAKKDGMAASGLADKVYEIYKLAAKEVMEEDERVYRSLLEEGKITEEQYEGLRLGKVTVGTGYNDIAESLKRNAVLDKGRVARPLYFEEPVKLQRGLYTSDSTSQYVLEERENRQEYRGNTLPVYSDTFVEYTDETLTDKMLLTLEKLELVTKNNRYDLNTSLSDYDDSEKKVTAIAGNCGLDPSTTKIVMNPNFAIIYDVNGDLIRIGDLFYNTKIDNDSQQFDITDKVVMQIRLALEQIVSGKQVDVNMLDEKQVAMYNKAMELDEEIDIERGVRHGK